jgi:fatty-acyl-CoA synthase
MPGWNFADVWEIVAEERPDDIAVIHADRRVSWRDIDRRADAVAQALLDLGAVHQDKVGQYLYNGPEYGESMFAAFKAGLVPVNTNYRYTADELVYLWDNADAIAVMFHGTFTETIEAIRDRVPGVRLWLWVDDGVGDCPSWATPYEKVAEGGDGTRTVAPWGRSGEDILMLYTGGTTGMPKGVMWRHEDLYRAFSSTTIHDPDEPDHDVVRARLKGAQWPPALPACPLMHGTGMFTLLTTWALGGAVVLLPSRKYDPAEMLDVIEREGVTTVTIVGDAFAKPMLRALDENPGRWDLSKLFAMVSSGVMWSEATKQGLLAHHPNMLLADAFSSSEALGMGQSISSGGGAAKTAAFSLGDNTRVITDDGRDVVPGSGEVGMLAVKGICPVGYYKDPEKSARTFKVIDGDRYSVPGDFATVEADGTLHVLGRGSVCINTGGEKVFPEEVEEALKEHPSVFDAVVVGVPDERFGEAIWALVEARPGHQVEEGELITHVKGRLAAFKAPRGVLDVATVGRSPAGKVDYARLRQEAIERSSALNRS